MARRVIDRVRAAVEAERTIQGEIGIAADGEALGLAPQTNGPEIALAPVKGVRAASVPPSSSSVAGPNAAVLLAMKAPLARFSVPLERLLAITRVPPLGAGPPTHRCRCRSRPRQPRRAGKRRRR